MTDMFEDGVDYLTRPDLKVPSGYDGDCFMLTKHFEFNLCYYPEKDIIGVSCSAGYDGMQFDRKHLIKLLTTLPYDRYFCDRRRFRGWNRNNTELEKTE